MAMGECQHFLATRFGLRVQSADEKSSLTLNLNTSTDDSNPMSIQKWIDSSEEELCFMDYDAMIMITDDHYEVNFGCRGREQAIVVNWETICPGLNGREVMRRYLYYLKHYTSFEYGDRMQLNEDLNQMELPDREPLPITALVPRSAFEQALFKDRKADMSFI